MSVSSQKPQTVPSLTVTEWALAEVADKLSTARFPAGCHPYFRLTVNNEGEPQLGIDNIRSDDRQYAYDGETVLVIAPALADQFKRRTLDINAAGDFLLVWSSISSNRSE